MSIAADILSVYKARISAIKKSNGFDTDLGAQFYDGWLAQALTDDQQQSYPLVLIQPNTDTALAQYSSGRLKLNISFDIIAVERVSADVHTNLLADLQDLRLALTDRNNRQQLNGHAIAHSVGDAIYTIPSDGSPVAWVALTVSADYQLMLKEQ